MAQVLAGKGAAAVGRQHGATQVIAMQIGQHAIFAHGNGLAVEAIVLGAAPTVMAYPGVVHRLENGSSPIDTRDINSTRLYYLLQ